MLLPPAALRPPQVYLPNPDCVSPTELRMLEFLGKMMGISLRQNATLPFQLPALIYKALSCEPPTLQDLAAVDLLFVQSVTALRDCHLLEGATQESFSQRKPLMWTSNRSDGEEVSCRLLPCPYTQLHTPLPTHTLPSSYRWRRWSSCPWVPAAASPGRSGGVTARWPLTTDWGSSTSRCPPRQRQPHCLLPALGQGKLCHMMQARRRLCRTWPGATES